MKTNIYAITDSHQESRNLSLLLSEIYNCEYQNTNQFLVLDAGDLFKGVYDKDLSVNAYLKIKELVPHAEIFITLGNNDFGFNNKDFEYLKSTIKKFEQNGINVICANLFNQKTKQHADWIQEYKIIEINETKILITGFCVNNSCAKKFGYELSNPEDTLQNLIKNIKEEYDKIIILNHHWYGYSKSLKETSTQNTISIDLIIGGHEHSRIQPDYENNIFYPLSFARSMYKFTIDKNLEYIKEVSLNECNFITELESPILKYEEETQLKKPLAKRVLNLTKCYSDPCPLGTFISDNMKRVGKTDIAFHSTGFTMYPLKIEDSDVITKYDLNKVICAESTIEKIEITVQQLKKVFENATINRMYTDRGNSRFIQCSQNISITGKGNPESKIYTIQQITIDGVNLLDKNTNPIHPNKKYTCAIDPYIGAGEQGFEVLKNIPKEKILIDENEVPINKLLLNSLIDNSKNNTQTSDYPCFKIIDL